MISLLIDLVQGLPCVASMLVTSYMLLGFVTGGAKRLIFTGAFEFVEHFLSLPLSFILTNVTGLPFPFLFSVLIFISLYFSSNPKQPLKLLIVAGFLGALTVLPQLLILLDYRYGIPSYVGLIGLPLIFICYRTIGEVKLIEAN